MLVCHCKGVTSKQINAEIARGADSVEEIGRRCGAGTGCGGCVPLIEMLLENHVAIETRGNQPAEPTRSVEVPVTLASGPTRRTTAELIAS